MNACLPSWFRALVSLPWLVVLLGLVACASEPVGPPRRETLWVVNDAAELLRLNAGQPQRVLDRKPLQGLEAGEQLVGIDFRVSRGVLFALGSSGRLYTLDTASARLSRVGTQSVALQGRRFAFDFNPVVDRIRVMSDSGQNLRLHPETGAVAASDPAPAYDAADAQAGRRPSIAAAAYTYNKSNDKLTTNYVIDLGLGLLATQGSREGTSPEVSPNTGRLFSVGPLGTGPLEDASLDIADIDNAALAALRQDGRTRLYLLNLSSGQATLLGTLDNGRAVWGLAIEP